MSIWRDLKISGKLKIYQKWKLKNATPQKFIEIYDLLFCRSRRKLISGSRMHEEKIVMITKKIIKFNFLPFIM